MTLRISSTGKPLASCNSASDNWRITNEPLLTPADQPWIIFRRSLSVLKEKKASCWSVKKPAFLFGLAPREGCGVTSEQLGQAMLWLEDALMFWGIGAKTATGYGHMDKDEAGVEKQRQELQSQEEARKEQARLATMAPEEVAMDAVRQRMERGESQGAGAGCPLGNDLSQLFTQAKLGKSIYQHLGVNLKKNKKVPPVYSPLFVDNLRQW